MKGTQMYSPVQTIPPSCRTFIVSFTTCALLLVSACNWTELVTVNNAGEQGTVGGYSPSLSGDGRYVAFTSGSDNLVEDDTNAQDDVFVRDTLNGSITRVSVDSAGNQANHLSRYPAISADGRYVSFSSWASNLVPNDTNDNPDLFLHDRDTGTTTRISVDSVGNQSTQNQAFGPEDIISDISADGRYVSFVSRDYGLTDIDAEFKDVFVHDRVTATTTLMSVSNEGWSQFYDSYASSISADGRYVAFSSDGDTLIPNDTNYFSDIFVRDQDTGTITVVSVNSDGIQANYYNSAPSISGDGRYVAFVSSASNLDPIYPNSAPSGIYVHDRVTGTTTPVSVNNEGAPANASCREPVISPDGRYVVFGSDATNLVPEDTNSAQDIFVRDTVAGTTWRVSLDAAGNQANGPSSTHALSADSRYVAFITSATNLFPNDTNGSWDVVIRALPQLSITSVLPDTLSVGVTTPVTVTGTNFLPGTTPALDAEISNVVIVDEQTITLDVTVPLGTENGTHDLSVYLKGTGPGQGRGVTARCKNCVTFTGSPGC